MKILWVVKITVAFTIQTAYLYPQTGVYMGLHQTADALVQPKNWTNIKGWKLKGNCKSKVCFNEDIKVLRDDANFVAPRSGLYYVSLYLESEASSSGQFFVNVTVFRDKEDKENEHYVTKFDSVKKRRHIKLDELVLFDKNDTVTVFLWSTTTLRLTSKSRITIQFLNTFQNIVGFVAYPTVARALSNTEPQVVVGWQTKFDLLNGFSTTTGTYVTVASGYYLVVLKLILKWSGNKVNVFIDENDTPFCEIEREIEGSDTWETITYVTVRQFSSRTKVLLKVSSSSKSSSISSDSTYSIIHLASLQPDECDSLLRHYYISKDTPIVSSSNPEVELGYRTKNWNKKSSKECNTVPYSDEFRVTSSGYFLISVELFLDRIPKKPVSLKLQFQYMHTVESSYFMPDSRRLSLSGVFFINENDNIICYVETKEEGLALTKASSLSVYDIRHDTHTYLYNIFYKKHNSLAAKKTRSLQLIQSLGSMKFINATQEGRSLKVLKSGIYYVVLNIFLGNKTSNNSLDFSVTHRNLRGDWSNVTTCYVFLSSNCYVPLTLLLLENEEIGVWVGEDSAQEFSLPPDSNTSFVFAQFVKGIDDRSSAGPQVTTRMDASNGFHTSTIDIPDEAYEKFQFRIPREGIYLITANIIFRTADIDKTLLQRAANHVVDPDDSRKVVLRLVQNKKDTLLSVEELVRRTNYVNLYFTWTYYFRTSERISLQHSLLEKNIKKTTLKIDPRSYFTILLLTENKKKYFALDGRFGGGRDISSGEMLWKPPNSKFYWMRDSPYVQFVYLFYPKRSFFALVSVTLIGKACPQADKGFMKISVRLKNNKEHDKDWQHMQARKYVNGRKCESVKVDVSGMISVHRDDMIDVGFVLYDLKFEPNDGTSFSLVVMEENLADVPLSTFDSSPITFQLPVGKDSEGPVTGKSGVYEIFFSIKSSKSASRRQRRDLSSSKLQATNQSISLSTMSGNITTNISTTATTTITTTTTTTTTPVPTPPPCSIAIVKKKIRESSLIANSTNIVKNLDRQVQDIWDDSSVLLRLQCHECNHNITLTTSLDLGTKISVERKACDDVITKIGVNEVSRKMDDFIKVSKPNDEDICNETGWIPVQKWKIGASDNDATMLLGSTTHIYKSSSYEFVQIYVNLFTYQLHYGRLFLVTNGQINEGEVLQRVEYSKNMYLYQLYSKRFLKRHESLQIYADCNGGSIKVLKQSKIDIIKREQLMRMVKDFFPVFVEHPRPTHVNASNVYNFTCALSDNRIPSYWNKIDMHTSKWTRFENKTRTFTITGNPEESGYYFCSANDGGYETTSNRATVDISDDDECAMMKNASSEIKPCHQDAKCINTVGSHSCECLQGFDGDGYLCQDVNECLEDPERCGNFSHCLNYDGGYNCSCFKNYRGNPQGMDCVDINECAENPPDFCMRELNLAVNITTCVNTPGSYNCKCNEGYTKKDGTCVDMDECLVDPDKYPCHERATCNNTIGTFSCKCDQGYKGDGKYCEDINECADESLYDCPANSTCENKNGTYRCVCDSGFKSSWNGKKLEKCIALGCFPPPVCVGQYQISWWARKPYIENETEAGSARGLFRDILTLMIHEICKNCSQLSFDTPINGSYILERLVEENDTDLACPLYGSKEQETFRGFPFIPIVEAPGVAFFVKDRNTDNSPLVGSLAGSWPILVVTLLLASLSGVIIWFLDTVRNPDEFPHSFLEGSWEGFWWAFITMTTVGYGDKAPRSFFARVFGIIWILIGLVIISTFTATITTVLTASSLSNEAKLYGTKVGALQNSEEFRLGVKRNADVKGYTSVPAIIAALRSGEIQGALLDTYIAGEFQDDLQDYKLQEILEHVFVYGLVLARDAEKLQKLFRTYLERKQSKIYNTISKVVKPLKENKASKAASQSSGALFDEKSAFFRTILIAGSAILGGLMLVGFLWDRYYWRRQREKDELARKTEDSSTDKTPMHQSWKTCDVIEYQKHAFKTEVLDLKQQISEFANIWVSRLDEMEGTHEQKLSRVQKWLGRSNGNNGGGNNSTSLLPNGSSGSKKSNGLKRIFLNHTDEDAV